MNQCLICVQIYNLRVTLVLMRKVTKEAKSRKTLMIRENKWYLLHVGTQVGSGGAIKDN